MLLIILFIAIIFIIQFILFTQTRKSKGYITLKEVIPDARIVSETEGIIEYGGKKFILGQSGFKEKRELINHLHLTEMAGVSEIDMRFDKQIIVRKNGFGNN
jgi:hypothetical protein